MTETQNITLLLHMIDATSMQLATLKTKQMDYKAELKQKMKQAGCTQKNLAEHLGIRQATISDYLTGKRPWNVDAYEEAIRYLNSLILKLP